MKKKKKNCNKNWIYYTFIIILFFYYYTFFYYNSINQYKFNLDNILVYFNIYSSKAIKVNK